MNCGLDVGVIIISFVIWRYLWLPTNKLKIKVIRDGTDYLIGPNSSFFALFGHIKSLIKQMIGLR